MRVRLTTSVLGIIVALSACSTDLGAKPDTAASARTGRPANAAQQTAPRTAAALESRLLDQSDLGKRLPAQAGTPRPAGRRHCHRLPGPE